MIKNIKARMPAPKRRNGNAISAKIRKGAGPHNKTIPGKGRKDWRKELAKGDGD